MSSRSVSVIIPVRNGARSIERCLEAVAHQSLQPQEIIVVDGHSTDETLEKVREFPARILFEDQHSRGGACEVGVENAQSEFVAFTDADCIPDRGWLENLANSFDEGIVGVGGQTVYRGHSLWERSIDLAFATFLGSARSVEGRLFQDKRFVSSISGCNSMYRRQAILDAGGFNAGFVSEDTELNKRLAKSGKLLYTPSALVAHDQEASLRGFARRIHKWGRTRVSTAKFDLQVVPPLMVPFLLLTLILTPWVLLSAVAAYLLIVVTMGAKFAVRERDPRYLFTIPIVYLIEHASYTAGIWRGIVRLWSGPSERRFTGLPEQSTDGTKQ
ncbi:MAG: glycosyltransferase [Chloroflexi bacterium]|nr:glycosyltransferase [Chloroflexota bacterium]